MAKTKRQKLIQKQRIQNLKKQGFPLYRFFEEEWQAKALLKGKVWISTLEKCREYECPQQGDSHEATSTYHQVYLHVENRIVTVRDHLILGHLGLIQGALPPPGQFFSGCLHCENNTRSTRIPNGFLLCTTNKENSLSDQSNNWNYGIQINCHPNTLFFLLNSALRAKKIPIVSGRHNWTDYDTNRIYTDPLQQPHDLAFIKPHHHKAQSEYRFFWEAQPEYDFQDGILVDCPQIIPYLKQVF